MLDSIVLRKQCPDAACSVHHRNILTLFQDYTPIPSPMCVVLPQLASKFGSFSWFHLPLFPFLSFAIVVHQRQSLADRNLKRLVLVSIHQLFPRRPSTLEAHSWYCTQTIRALLLQVTN